MRAAIAGFATGIIILQQQAALPSLLLLIFYIFLAACCLAASFPARLTRPIPKLKTILRFTGGLFLGISWATVFALFYLSKALPVELEGKNLVVTGIVSGLPRANEQGRSFLLDTEYAEYEGRAVDIPPTIALTWNKAFQKNRTKPLPDIRPGERWRLNIRIKRPHGNANPYGFDYEAWLLKQNIRATGYVRDDEKTEVKNRLLDTFVTTPSSLVHRARDQLRDHIRDALPDARYAGVIIALVIGDQQGIPSSDWDIFNRTGISHLVSISGLHITLISGMFALLFSFLWRHSFFFPRLQLPLILPAQKAAAIAGAAMACLYVLLAGFGIPAQRTLYMLTVVAIAILAGRITRVSHILFAALGVVLIYDPWAVMAPGFWLSFGAIGIILYISVGRKNNLPENAGYKDRWLQSLRTATKTQLAITIGLVPLTLLFFGRISIISPIANAIAIPLVGILVTPLSLVGSIMPDFLAPYLLKTAHLLIHILAALLEWLSAFQVAVWAAPIPSPYFFILAIAGTLWMLAPRGWPHRWIGMAFWLPLILANPDHPESGQAWATALDVGQGSAVLIETKNHRLLYDTGPAYTSENDAGERIIIPYLQSRGIRKLDTLVLSHGDNDHAGGARSILENRDITVNRFYSSLAPDHTLVSLAEKKHRLCMAGQAWEWDGVRFEMLWPTPEAHLAPDSKNRDNSISCVLKISAGSQSILLPGDIGVKEESELITREGTKLKSDILLVPHHGSHTSSSTPFIGTVQPGLAIFQLGYANRYNHPHDIVWQRYRIFDVTPLRTDRDGAIKVEFGRHISVRTWRKEHARYWYGE